MFLYYYQPKIFDLLRFLSFNNKNYHIFLLIISSVIKKKIKLINSEILKLLLINQTKILLFAIFIFIKIITKKYFFQYN